MSKDPIWLAKVAHIEVLIELYGICNAMGAFIQAIENMEEEMLRDVPDFEGTPHHKNIEHYKKVIELTMNACDLDDRYGSAESRKVNMERFKDRMEEIGVRVC